MPVEQRGQVIAVEHGPTGSNREEPEGSAGRRQPSRGDTSRMNREVQVRICEGLGAKLPGPTRQPEKTHHDHSTAGLPSTAENVYKRPALPVSAKSGTRALAKENPSEPCVWVVREVVRTPIGRLSEPGQKLNGPHSVFFYRYRKYVSIGPFPLTSIDPRGSNQNALPSALRVAAETWTRPGKP